MSMDEITIGLSETVTSSVFKAKCLKLLDEVAETGKEIVITKRGKRIARLVRVEEKREKIRARTKGTCKIHGDIFSTGEKWNADSEEGDPFLNGLGKRPGPDDPR